MDTANQPENKQLTKLKRTQIARAIFSAAESMGMSDRNKIEQLTSQIIARLEQPLPPTLPGMEDLVVSKHRHIQKRLPTEDEIEAMVREILAAEEPAKLEEVQPEMETETKEMSAVLVKPKTQPSHGINLLRMPFVFWKEDT